MKQNPGEEPTPPELTGQTAQATQLGHLAANDSGILPLNEALSKRSRRRFLGLTADDAIKYFFGGNAAVAIVVLLLIMLLLLKEGFDFVPLNHFNTQVYRQAGLEYVDILRGQVEDQAALGRSLQQIRLREVRALDKQGLPFDQINARLASFDQFSLAFSDSMSGHQEMLSALSDQATEIKQRVSDAREKDPALVAAKAFDFRKETAPIRETFPAYKELNAALASTLSGLAAAKVDVLPADRPALDKFQKQLRAYAAGFPAVERKMALWDPLKPVPSYFALTSFLFGPHWITASFWQDWYGVLPLFFGSLAVSIVALVLAVPFSLGAAIYINQIASRGEQNFIKPYIEFIAAIPSVVFGFFGVAVLGSALREMSTWKLLAWVPFFPMTERLTIFTAGCLLALMAVPTIFTLAEDALNNVPRAFTEASTALGATKFQTIVRIMFPAALSGIISAVLLGLGRVIGETMVVLLCVGGRIQIPDFLHQGVGAFFQPAHTMTGIIAQEMGEASKGSLEWRALFMVGMLLFIISLFINYAAQLVVKRYKVSIG